MSRQRAGLRKEHDLSQAVYEASGGSIIPLRAGWSGNSAIPAPDLLIPLDGSLRVIELKTSKQDRLYVKQEDVEDIMYWAMEMNELPSYPYLSVKFTYYEMYTGRLYKPWDIEDSFEKWAKDAPFEAHVTNSGNLSIKHPKNTDTGISSAAQSQGDGVALIRDLKLDDEAHGTWDRDIVNVADVLQQAEDYTVLDDE